MNGPRRVLPLRRSRFAAAMHARQQPATHLAVVLSTARRTLGVTELLEKILAHLPLEDLFVIQRTNKKFRDTIAGSLALRVIMHLEPQPPVYDESSVVVDPDGKRCLYGDSLWFDQCIPLRNAIRSMNHGPHTVILRLDEKRLEICFDDWYSHERYFGLVRSNDTDSWRRMMAGFPGYTIDARYDTGFTFYNSHVVTSKDNLTLGDLFDELAKPENRRKGCTEFGRNCKIQGCKKH